jgi:hypothetical protein
LEGERESERRLLLSWAKAEKDYKEGRKATRSEGDDLEESATRALEGEDVMSHAPWREMSHAPWREKMWWER